MSLGLFDRFSNAVAHKAGSAPAFAVACGAVVVWAVSGPLFGFSESWQLVINTGTTIITFLMVFVVQRTQNRDGEAIQAKLDDLIFALRKADNRFIGAELLTSAELRELRELALSRRGQSVRRNSDSTVAAPHPAPTSTSKGP